MNAIVLDTYALVKDLTAAGMPEPQAKVIAEHQAELIENELATKRDVKELETKLIMEIKGVTVRIAGVIVAVGVVTALTKLL